MQLDPQEKSRVWWKGTLKGALKGLLIGAIVGIGAAFILSGAIGAFSVLEPIFGGFLSMSGVGGPFSVLPLAIFNGVLGMVSAAFSGGDAAVAAYHEQKHHELQEAKITELEGREQRLEQAVSPARQVQTILTRGPRTATSFAEAEAARSNAPSTHTLQ